jgi:ABC-type sulfate/molybdate transport systems ATPase subunit
MSRIVFFIQEAFRALRRNGAPSMAAVVTTVVVVTHDREMVDNMRRRVVELYEGRVVRDEVSGGYTEESTTEFGMRMRAEMGVGAEGEPRTNGHSDHDHLG